MSRYFAFFALVALAAAYPASDDFPRPITTITESDFEDQSPWFRFPPFGNIFAPLTKLFSSFAEIGPKIEIDEDKFRVIVNVKDYKKKDLKVKVKGDYILVQGAHEAKHDDHDLFASQFFHTYSLPLNASASDVTATLSSDGYLDVTAPVNGVDDKNKVVDREVPIVESGKPLKEDKEDREPVVPVASADPVETVDKTENVDKIETFDTPVEPLAKVENADKVENLEPPVEPSAKADNVDTIEVPNAPVEPLAKVENINKVENRIAPEEPITNVENVDKVESPAVPEEPVAKVENVDKVETPDAPVVPVAKDENVDNVETPDVSVEPLPKVDNVDKVEQLPEVTTATASEGEEKTEAPTTQAPAREEVKEDIKVPQDNEVNEIQP
ncbi:heat shock protein 67B1-like [Bicyclus anynana]|uniref:Heat shock protein 67B1-like n=1 Tax=Bicyclus anynana TaxID=110368 RepID=A0A6J1NU87_BICAN|nr:heat shock protein 67B1-like [Bicyclus anynana]